MPDVYMVPSKVYVGDRASLMVPLPGFAGMEVQSQKGESLLMNDVNIDIHQIAIERRPGGSFLAIEFSAYAPGILELPPITIAGETFSGLTVEISSILDSDESGMILSAPALPLAIPGTSILIYGSVSAAVLLVLAVSWGLFWGRKQVQGWLEAWRRRRLLAAIQGTERRLYRALLKGVDCRKILDILSTEFRNFLTDFTGTAYRAMTAAEMSRLDIPQAWDSTVLGQFFKRCDGIRFSGRAIHDDETMAVLGDLRQFLAGVKA